MLTHRLGYYLNFQLDHLNLMDAIYYFYIDTEQVAVDSLSSVVNCMVWPCICHGAVSRYSANSTMGKNGTWNC